jgi:hypothetical protein
MSTEITLQNFESSASRKTSSEMYSIIQSVLFKGLVAVGGALSGTRSTSTHILRALQPDLILTARLSLGN